MGIFKFLDNVADKMADKILHGKISGPTFINEQADDQRIETLRTLLDKVIDEQKPIVQRELTLMEIGDKGEENVIYELKHSKEDIVILHNITLEDCYKDSQIDFLIISRHAIIVLETKKLSGDIEINKEGDFIRYYKTKDGKIYKKEGIYSPVTQNRYHIDAVRKLLVENKFIKRLPIYSLVVIANPKTIIKNYAPEDIKNQIVKYDQLNNKISELINNKEFDISDNRIIEISEFLIKMNKPRTYDYVSNLNLKFKDEQKEVTSSETKKEESSSNNENELTKELKSYRYSQSQKEKVKPYLIFSNNEMEELIEKKPSCIEELMNVKGFGKVKAEKYGEAILEIIKKYN